MQTSDQIVNTLLEADDGMPDPKQIALQTHNDSELFEDFMRNYVSKCRELYARAKTSGALAGDEPEGFVIRSIMQIAAKEFEVESMISGQYRRMHRNLQKFL